MSGELGGCFVGPVGIDGQRYRPIQTTGTSHSSSSGESCNHTAWSNFKKWKLVVDGG